LEPSAGGKAQHDQVAAAVAYGTCVKPLLLANCGCALGRCAQMRGQKQATPALGTR